MKTLKTLTRSAALTLVSATCAFAQSLDYLPDNSFYKDYKKSSWTDSTPFHLPVAIDQMVFEEFDYQDRAVLLEPLVAAMNAHLDSLGWSWSLETSGMPEKGSPYVFVGSSEALTAPPGSEMMREDFHDFPPMVVYVKKPSKTWKSELQSTLTAEDAGVVLSIRLGFVEYPKARKNFFEKKVVLGTGYERTIRFLSAEDEPVEVLQLTGILLNQKGEVLRAGAEGIIHEDTPFWAQAFDIQKGVDDKKIASAISDFRRDDLPGNPLAWQVALETLVQELISPYGS